MSVVAPVIVPLYSWGERGIEKGCFIIIVIVIIIIIIVIIIIIIIVINSNNNNNRIGSEPARF